MLKLTWYNGAPWHERYHDTGSIYSETGDRRRKHHRKSKNGCSHCRKRRVKCSEDKPACRRCARLKIDCEYRNKSPTPSVDSPPPGEVAADSMLVAGSTRSHVWACMDDLDKDLASFRPLIQAHAIEHLDHFVKCDQSWLKNPTIQHVMQHEAIAEVMGQPYLLHAVLAVSAAHLAVVHKDKAASAVISMVHWQRFLREYRRCFQSDLTMQNVHALFFASHLQSMLVSVHTRPGGPDDTWTIPEWIHSLQGIKVLWDVTDVYDRLQYGPWQPWTARCERDHQDIIDEAVVVTQPGPVLAALQSYCDASLSAEDAKAHKKRIDFLSIVESHGSSPQGRTGLSWFIARASPDYMAQLRRSDEVALLLLMYWCRLAARAAQWWQAEAARHETEKLHAYVSHVYDDNKTIMSLLDAIVNIN